MERESRGSAFLIRLDDAPETGAIAGVVTHIQSGECVRFQSFAELERFINERRLGTTRSPREPEKEEEEP